MSNAENPLAQFLSTEELSAMTQPAQIPDGAARVLGGIGLGGNTSLQPPLKAEPVPETNKYTNTEVSLLTIQEILDQDSNAELSKEQLKFLYEIDGWLPERKGDYITRHPIIDGLISQRNGRKDIAKALDIDDHQIAFSQDEWNPSETVYLSGNFVINAPVLANLAGLPKYVRGHVGVSNLSPQIQSLVKLPERIWGHLAIETTEPYYSEELKLPDWVGNDLRINNLESTEKIKLPSFLGRQLILESLTSTEGLTNLLDGYSGMVCLPKALETEAAIDDIRSNNPKLTLIFVNFK